MDHSETSDPQELQRIREEAEAHDVAAVDDADRATAPDDGRLVDLEDGHGNPITLRYSERLALERAREAQAGSLAAADSVALAGVLADDVVAVTERIGRFRMGPISRAVAQSDEFRVHTGIRGDGAAVAGAEIFAGPDADAADGGPLSLTALRDTLLEEVDKTLRGRPSTRVFGRGDVADVVEIGRLASAAKDVDEIIARIAVDQATKPAPAFDVDALCARVWNAVQEAGAPTTASDAAVDEIRAATS